MTDSDGTYQAIEELLPLYAVGALEPEQLLVVDDYLRHHPELQARLQSLETAVGQLAYAAPDVPLPPAAKQRLMERVRQEPPPGPRPTIILPRAVPPRRPAWRTLLRPPIWGSALVALLVVLVLSNLALRRQLPPLADPTARSILISTPAAPEAKGELFLYPDGRGVLRIAGLPRPPAGRAYQFWFARPDKSRDSAGVFQVGPEGDALVNITVPGALAQYDQIWVTQEPAGGSPKPTPPHFLEGPLVQ